MTGASSGIGRAFAVDLASRGHDLLIVARRGERLRSLADELAAAHGTVVDALAADLATPEGLAAVRAALDEQPVQTAVLNAGFGSRGRIGELDRVREVQMVRLNVEAIVDLASHVVGPMRTAGAGSVVVIASVAAWQPIAYMATYAASKAFELSFAEALFEELRGTGVRVVAACPGPVRTEFATAAGSPGAMSRLPHESAQDVVTATWRAMERGKPFVATSRFARVMIGCARILPRRVVVRATAHVQARSTRR